MELLEQPEPTLRLAQVTGVQHADIPTRKRGQLFGVRVMKNPAKPARYHCWNESNPLSC